MIERIIFTLVSFLLFAYIFLFKMMKKNDTTYLVLLLFQAIGILMNLIRVLFDHAHLRRDHSGVFRAEHYRHRQRLHLSGYPGGCRLCKGGSRNGCRCRQGK